MDKGIAEYHNRLLDDHLNEYDEAEAKLEALKGALDAGLPDFLSEYEIDISTDEICEITDFILAKRGLL
jgi:hypothetical protein